MKLNDRNDLEWDGPDKILHYKDWGTAHNKCPYCGCKHQLWYLAWKKNIKKWAKSSITGIFVRLDNQSVLGGGQQKELRYLLKKKYNITDMTFNRFKILMKNYDKLVQMES